MREPFIWATAFAAATVLGTFFVGWAPFAAYVWLIALFGLPHVVTELRYCDERFSARIPRMALATIGLLLAALATMRLCATYGAVEPHLGAALELALGGALAATATLFMRRLRPVGLGLAATIVFGALYAPILTFFVWSWLHNLTPLGFVVERLDRRYRVPAVAALTIPFLIAPGLVAFGGLDWLTLHIFGHDALAAPSAFGAGASVLGAFLPRGIDRESALPLFQAAVLAQVMHYVAVIVLLPRLGAIRGIQPGRLVPWPRWRIFYGSMAALGLISVAVYALAYGEARSAYGLAATLHSWIELPIFLMALGGGFGPVQPRRMKPAITEAALATNEMAIALPQRAPARR